MLRQHVLNRRGLLGLRLLQLGAGVKLLQQGAAQLALFGGCAAREVVQSLAESKHLRRIDASCAAAQGFADQFAQVIEI